MIVFISDGAMAKRDVILHENHYGGPTQDRLIQNKLLAADDRLEKEYIIRLIEISSKPKTTRVIKERSEELTGWNHNSKTVLRKPEKEPLNVKGREGQRESLSWRDSRLKLPNPRDNFVFKHYQDIRYYIKQYREEHSSLDTSVPQPPKRVSAFYNSGYYNVAPQPVNREYTNAQILARITQNIHQNGNQNGTFQYTRREHTKTDIRRDCPKSEKPPSGMVRKYKLVPNVTPADSESSSECDIRVGSSPRKNSNGSKSSSSTPVKSPTKVCVPCTNNPSGVSTKLSSNGVTGSPTGQPVKLEVSSNGSRTLDTLACVAAQEGQIHISPRTLDGLTWREKLEVLRQINKPRERSRRPPLRLTFYKADAECAMIGCRDPMSHDPMSHDQISQQRRIKHLIEQTRLKLTTRHPPDFVTSRSKYWVNDPDSELDVHLNISRPKFTFSKRDRCSNTPRRVLLASDLSDDIDHVNVQYRLSALEKLRIPTNTVPSLTWQAAAHQCHAPDMTPRSYTCVYPGDNI